MKDYTDHWTALGVLFGTGINVIALEQHPVPYRTALKSTIKSNPWLAACCVGSIIMAELSFRRH